MISMVLLCFAFVIFCFAAWGWPAGRWSLIALGLAFWVASQLLGGPIERLLH
jgi:hypothetical protein